MATITELELYRACGILFGGEVDFSLAFLEYIQPAGVKKAYRKLARMTHPDTAANGNQEACPEKFMEAHWAYESLKKYIQHREHSRRHRVFRGAGRDSVRRPHMRRRKRRYSTSETSKPGGTYYKAWLPQRRLMFGEYLLYKGVIPWETLIKAIVWQRRQRPRLGELARKKNWLTHMDIAYAFRCRRRGESLGDTLVRLKICTRPQVTSLLKAQREMHQPFGEFFIMNGYLSREYVNNVLYKDFIEHNKVYEAPAQARPE